MYAGYAFLDRKEVDDANRKYLGMNRQLKEALGTSMELKASVLSAKHKRSLYNVLREYNSVSVAVDISKIYDRILCDKRSICRYKDFILKRVIKRQVQAFVDSKTLSPDDDVTIKINIDEQLTASDGRYSLGESVAEELSRGIYNFDYGVQHPRVLEGKVNVSVRYCNSKNNYLIQASDILANRIWTSYCVQNASLRKIPKHTSLALP